MIVEKDTEFEPRIENLEKITIEKDTIENIEKNKLTTKIDELAKAMEVKDIEIKSLHHKMENLEKKTDLNNESNDTNFDMTFCKPPETVHCDYCDFDTNNERGLKVHMHAKHEVKKM